MGGHRVDGERESETPEDTGDSLSSLLCSDILALVLVTGVLLRVPS